MNRPNTYFSIVVSAGFFILGCFMAWHHELWIDESYHYLLAKESASLSEMRLNATPSGHPILWNILLYYYRIIAPDIFQMQVLHCLIATCCIFMITCYSPFSRLEKILIAFGYFFVYEYNVIAKNYILGFALVFAALILFERKRSLVLISLLLGLAANLHLFTCFLATCLFIYICSDYYRRARLMGIILPGLVFLALSIIAMMQIIPPAEIIAEYRTNDMSSFFSLARFKRAFGSLGAGLLNIPDFRSRHFWNSNLIYNMHHSLIYLCSAGLLVMVVHHLRKSKKLLLLFFCPALLIMGFVYFTPLSTGVRYWGYYYLLLILCTWLISRQTDYAGPSRVFFKAVLLIQFLISAPALLLDYAYPFSNAKQAATALQEQNHQRHPYFTEMLALGPSLSAYAGKEIYYPSSRTFETFSYWFRGKTYTRAGFVEESLHNLSAMRLDTCVLVLRQPMPDSVSIYYKSRCTISKIGAFEGAILPYENFFLYLLSRKND